MNKTISLLSLTIIFSGSLIADRIVDINVNGKTYQAKEGYLLIKFKNPSAKAQGVKSLHTKAQAQVVKQFPYLDGLELVRVHNGANSMAALKTYQEDPEIEYAEPNYIWHSTTLPNDPLFSQQWGLRNFGQSGGKVNADINAVAAWQYIAGDKNVVLGVIDTGVDYTHPDLANNMWRNSLETSNGKDDDGNGFIDDIHGINAINFSGNPMDDNGHGTHVAGIMAAEQNNGYGISGVAPGVSIAACKFLDASGSGDTVAAITCLNYFRSLANRSNDPVRIVATNNSWAGGPYSQALHDAIKAHQQAGILFIAAASNEGQNNDRVNTYPANFYLSNIVSVAATNRNDGLANFSNYGKVSVSIAAPGVDIQSTFPEAKFARLSGTSMAAPHVTGLAGLIASYDLNKSWIGIKNLILAGGEPIAAANGTTLTGRRILAYGQNGFGSLSCFNKSVVARNLPRSSNISMKLGQGLGMSILSINCEKSTQSTSFVAISKGVRTAAQVIRDDGSDFDQVAGDGVYSGVFRPTSTGTYYLRFPGNDVVTVNVSK